MEKKLPLWPDHPRHLPPNCLGSPQAGAEAAREDEFIALAGFAVVALLVLLALLW